MSVTAIPLKSRSPEPARSRQKHQRFKAAEVADDTSLSMQAYSHIKRDIIQCQLGPGSEISEALLAKRYGFGKAPIRAALARLSQDNLVHGIQRRGYIVAPITIRTVHEMYELRLILEPAAAVAAMSHINIQYLRSLCKQLKYSDTEDGKLKFLISHHEFHTAIARTSGNERLTILVSSLLSDMGRLIHFGEFAPDRDAHDLHFDHKLQQQQHEAIIESLAVGDAEMVQKVMRQHIEHSLQMAKEAMFASRSSVAF